MYRALLTGLAIGDAFGAGIEFQDRHWIRQHVDFSTFVNARHRIAVPSGEGDLFTQNYRAWDYTDDTEMTLGLIHALLSGENFTETLLLDYWSREYQKGVAEKGFGRNGHGSMRWYYEGTQSMEQIRAFQRERAYPGNAPPMRAVPLGFLPSEHINPYAIINADATHPHPKARAASILVARATEFLLCQQGSQHDLISYCHPHIEGIDAETSDLLLQVDQLPLPSELSDAHYAVLCGPQPIVAPRFLPGINGLPSDAMLTGGAILYVLKHAQDAFDGLKIAVGVGGDVDSLASVCCGILSARYGLDTLPAFMVEQVEGLAYLRGVGDQMEAAISPAPAPPYCAPHPPARF